ncbi:hypothetical protein C3K47_02445 [Solitalea longa]|uniref:Cupin n=1 Tax=Solitalea longa TaxID=2079460 RepID=A0A2S5AA28_9SPHI|nr:hypothetical protein [Solitalea longa]POY39376.1 hypothetical protein C3K47_02445 [Solitalea longa]
MENRGDKWEWPEELDALVAAPEHHRLLSENGYVRVIDTLIPPGEITKLHTHKWPASLYVISWSDFIRYDEDNNIVLDSRNLASTPVPASSLWSEALAPHSLKNIGDKDIHIISVEIKNTNGSA